MSTKEHNGADEVLAKIKTYKDDFRADAEEIHTIILSAGKNVFPRLWYGMPGYASTKAGPVLIYFRKDKFITFGQTESADISFDAIGAPIATAWFINELNDVSRKMISELASSVLKS